MQMTFTNKGKMETRKVDDYNECVIRNYRQIENGMDTVRGLRTEAEGAEACLARIGVLASPEKEAAFVRYALAGVFCLDRAA